MKRRDVKVKVLRPDPDGHRPADPARPVADGMSAVWPLTLDAWAFKGEGVAESRLPRHVVRVVRRGR